jgi:hypothetical protein
MLRDKLRRPVAMIILLIMVLVLPLSAGEYIPTNRDTLVDPEPMEFVSRQPEDFSLLYETERFKFYFRDDRDVLAVYDKRNGYTWKTGLDIPFSRDIDNAIDEAVEKGETPNYIPKEDRLNTTYTGIANSLITVEYYDQTYNIKRTSSAPHGKEASKLMKFTDDHYRLDISFADILLDLKVHIYFDDHGVRYEIRDEEIQGEDVGIMAAVLISPFLGSSGGVKVHWNEEEQEYNILVPNEIIPGYVFVPDGSGALIRFKDNSSMLRPYTGDVYGRDYSQSTYYYDNDQGYVPFKNPAMPVFGIAHGQDQNAFVAYAVKGGEYMEIVVMPEENVTHYTWAYPRFVYNTVYHQVYNRRGDGYFTAMEDRNHFDVEIRYDFLQGDGSDGSPSADYVGMAIDYRGFLADSKVIADKKQKEDQIPIRLDFVMSDVKNSIFGYEDVIVTTAAQAKDILLDIYDAGINRISSGLLGFQKGGITTGKPWKVSWSREIGKKNDFVDLITTAKEKGIDVSFSQDYTVINEVQMILPSNAAKHINGWLNEYWHSRFTSFPIEKMSYARPKKSAEWLVKQTDIFKKLGVSSFTIDGITNKLLSDYSRQGNTVTEAISMYQNLFRELNNGYKINAYAPNQYLWSYVDRFLNTPVFSTQYIIETDNVPFLQMVLSGSMELYAPYSNFSFYTDKDCLRMIDFNVYPSFLLSHESSHYLAPTNSANFYSTEYNLYKELIQKIYSMVNSALSQVADTKWINREVLENGIVLNTYENGVQILINYTDNPFRYRDEEVKALSYSVFK